MTIVRIGTLEVDINPTFPVNRMLSEEKHQAVADDLHCRVVVFDDGAGRPFVHISVDTVELYRSFRDRLKAGIEAAWGREVDLVTSATHSHFCPCLTTDGAYRDFVYERVMAALPEMRFVDARSLEYSYTYRFFDKTGRSRISHQDSPHVYAETLSFYADGSRLVTFLVYNSHATTMRMRQGDFTSEYIGKCIEGLKARYPGEFFTFMLGPAGDISARFTRRSQEYLEIDRLAGMLLEEYVSQLEASPARNPVGEMRYREEEFAVGRGEPEVEGLEPPADASPAELAGIEAALSGAYTQPVDFALRPKSHLFAHWAIAPGYSVIFEPFETYSSYYGFVDKDRCTLATISNGFDHYLCDLNPAVLSRELFTDNVTRETKERLARLLASWSAQEDI